MCIRDSRKSIETLVAYAQASAKYLAGIEAVVRRARFLATKENRTKVLFANIKEAIQESAILSDGALAKALSTPINPYANRLQEVVVTFTDMPEQLKRCRRRVNVIL